MSADWEGQGEGVGWDLEEGRAAEGSFGKILSSPESSYTRWSAFTVQTCVAPFLSPCAQACRRRCQSLMSASQSPCTQSASGCK